jgi:cytoskeleton protein RodZ
LTIEDIAARTRIKAGFLNAIERGHFELLPGPFFARTFLRTYARELGLSPADIVSEYDASVSRSSLPASGVASAPVEPQHRVRVRSSLLPLDRPASRSAWPVVALAAVLLVLLFAMNRPVPSASNHAGVVGTSGVAEGGPAIVTDAPPASPRLLVEIRPSRPVWVTASADGERVIYRLLQPGDRVTVDAQENLSFRVGDAGAFEYSINGVPAKTPGAPGEVREFRITRENYRTFQR